jgi:phosphate starvation-inducible PhoH-like protein
LRRNRKEASKTPNVRLSDETNVVKLGNRYKKIEMIPRNVAQEDYVEALIEKRMVFAVGPAGTGKTMLAVLRAIQALRNGEITKIVLTRPAVSVDEKHGFLPGDLNAKMEPWTRPIFDVFEEYYGFAETQRMLADNIIEIAPLGFMRGRTFKHAYVLVDEAQNTTIEQMKMVLTRLGEGSSMIVTGDLKQHDRGFEKNGLEDFLKKLPKADSDISVCYFSRCHVERDPIVGKILGLYGED